MFIYIGGVNGAGKTTFIEKVVEIARKQNCNLYDSGVDQILCDMAGVPTLREWRILSEDIRDSIRPKMEVIIRDIDAQDPGAIRLRDVHFVFSRAVGERGLRIIQSWEKGRLSGIAVVVADPTIILQRRLKDVTLRPDRKFDVESIAEEQDLELCVARWQSIEIGVPLKVVENETPDLNGPCEELFKFCTSVAVVK